MWSCRLKENAVSPSRIQESRAPFIFSSEAVIINVFLPTSLGSVSELTVGPDSFGISRPIVLTTGSGDFDSLSFLLELAVHENIAGIAVFFRKRLPFRVIKKSLFWKCLEQIFVNLVILNFGPSSRLIFTIHVFIRFLSLGREWKEIFSSPSMTYPVTVQSGTQQQDLFLFTRRFSCGAMLFCLSGYL